MMLSSEFLIWFIGSFAKSKFVFFLQFSLSPLLYPVLTVSSHSTIFFYFGLWIYQEFICIYLVTLFNFDENLITFIVIVYWYSEIVNFYGHYLALMTYVFCFSTLGILHLWLEVCWSVFKFFTILKFSKC